MTRSVAATLRVGLTLLVTAAAVAYIVSKVDLGKTIDIISNASVPWLVLSGVLTIVTVPPQAIRWKWLLRARGIEEGVPWLTRAYFVSYAVGQVLPTSVGGDASRIFETSRRHPGQITPITGSVLLERALGGAVTCCSQASGCCLRSAATDRAVLLGRGDLRPRDDRRRVRLLLSNGAFRARRFALPWARKLRVEPAARAVYDGLHGYREHPRTLLAVAGVTLVAQFVRVLAIYASGRAVGIDLGLLPYVVLGPLLFLVMLVPFTVNGLGVREAFFVSFLGKLGIRTTPRSPVASCSSSGTLLLAAPGVAILLWENVFNHAPVADGTT